MTALFEFDCCSYLSELQSWQPDSHYTTTVLKTNATAALLKNFSTNYLPGLPMAMFFNIFHVCNVNVVKYGKAWIQEYCLAVFLMHACNTKINDKASYLYCGTWLKQLPMAALKTCIMYLELELNGCNKQVAGLPSLGPL